MSSCSTKCFSLSQPPTFGFDGFESELVAPLSSECRDARVVFAKAGAVVEAWAIFHLCCGRASSIVLLDFVAAWGVEVRDFRLDESLRKDRSWRTFFLSQGRDDWFWQRVVVV